MLSSFLFIRWRKGNGDEEMVIRLSFRKSDCCVALVTVKGLLWRISHRDRVSSPEGIGRILASTGLSDLVSRLLNFGRASFTFEAVSIFPNGLYGEEGEGAHRLDAWMNHSSSWSPKLSRRTPRRGCDTITFLHVLPESVWCRGRCRASWGLLERPHFATLVGYEGRGIALLIQESWRKWK